MLLWATTYKSSRGGNEYGIEQLTDTMYYIWLIPKYDIGFGRRGIASFVFTIFWIFNPGLAEKQETYNTTTKCEAGRSPDYPCA